MGWFKEYCLRRLELAVARSRTGTPLRIKRDVIVGVSLFFLVPLGMAFIKWDINPAHWAEVDRAGTAIMAAVVGFFGWALTDMRA